MIYSVSIGLIFLLKLNRIETQTFISGYFDIILSGKDLTTNSSNLIKSFQSEQNSCLLECNLNILCNLVIIYNSTGRCSLCKKEALSELINSGSGQNTTVFQSQKQVSNIFNGLVNYWPIVNDLRDYVGSSDMTTGPLDAGETIGFTNDRFNNLNGAIYMNPGYYIVPPGFYFNNSYSFLVWIKVLAYNPWSRIIDCANGPDADNVVIALSFDNSEIPYTEIYIGYTPQVIVSPANSLPINTWFHLAVVYDSQNLMMYINGNLVANSTSNGPKIVYRTQCYIGRSNWHAIHNDPDSSACFDDLMIYNRALPPDEVQNCMNAFIN